MRRAAQPHDRGREAGPADRSCRRRAQPPCSAAGVGCVARRVELTGGRLGQYSRVHQEVQWRKGRARCELLRRPDRGLLRSARCPRPVPASPNRRRPVDALAARRRG